MRYRDFSRVALILGRASGRILPLIFQNHGAQDAPLDEILNGCIVDRKEFLRAQPWDGDKVFFVQGWLPLRGSHARLAKYFTGGPNDGILSEDTLESAFKWRPSRIPCTKYLGSCNKATS
jgi:hypothetical protein